MNANFMFWASSIAACVSLTGACLNAHKKWYSFVVWACANIFWLIYDLSVGAYFQSALFGAYLSMNVYGLYCWKFKKNKGNKESETAKSEEGDAVISKNSTAKYLKRAGVSTAIIAGALELSESEVRKVE